MRFCISISFNFLSEQGCIKNELTKTILPIKLL